MPKRKIDPRQLLRDLRSGLADTGIMEKYHLTQSEFQRLIRKMMIAGYLHESEVFQWLRLTDSQFFSALGDTTQILMEETDGLQPESPPPMDHLEGVTLVVDEDMVSYAEEPAALHIRERVPIHTVGDSISRGLIRDLAEKSIRAASTDPKMFEEGSLKTLSITCELIRTADPILLTAKCGQRERRGSRKKYYQGVFEVTDITEDNLDKVRRLIARLTHGAAPRE
jgi:hypothetical protein